MTVLKTKKKAGSTVQTLVNVDDLLLQITKEGFAKFTIKDLRNLKHKSINVRLLVSLPDEAFSIGAENSWCVEICNERGEV